MGRVYEVVDDKLGKSFALKETFYDADEELRNAFKREARTLAALEDEAFPQVTHFFTDNDGCFLVMELIRGDDLKDLLEKRVAPFEQKQVLDWANQILDALEYLHLKGIIHRDIKPANLKLTSKNKIKLLDLGIAKAKLKGVTEMATILAITQNYSPLEQILYPDSEQAKFFTNGFPLKAKVFINQSPIPPSDIYSLGATLYTLLTNSVPISASERASAIWANKPDELKPAHEVNPQISTEVSKILQKAMSIDFNERYQSTADMRQGLTVDDIGEQVTKLSPRKFKPKLKDPVSTIKPRIPNKNSTRLAFLNRRNILTVIITLSALSLLGLGVSYYLRDHSFKTLTPKNTKDTSLAVFSSDSKNIVGYGLGPISIWDANGDNLTEVQIEQGCSGENSVLSFNGSLIANATNRIIKICDTASGNLKRTLEEQYYVKDLAFSPDNKTIASLSYYSTVTKGFFPWEKDKYEYESTVKLWNVEDGISKNIISKSEQLKSVTFSPDGKTIAISDSNSIKLWDIANNNVRQTINAYGSKTVFSPDGKTIANDGSSENEINLYDVVKGNFKQSFKNNNWMPGQNSDVYELAFSPDGNTIIGYGDDQLIRLWDIASGNLKRALAGHNNVKSIRFSPDGKTIVSSNGETIKLWHVE